MNRSNARVAGIAVAVAALLTALIAAIPAAGAAPAAPARTASAPFVIIVMENHGLHPVLNDRTDMPFLNSLWRGGASLDFAHYAALAHPSLPNYLGMASGFTQVGSDAVHPCCAATLSPMYALETGPAVTPGADGTSYSHYSVLAGIENAYGLSLLGGAATANPVPVP